MNNISTKDCVHGLPNIGYREGHQSVSTGGALTIFAAPPILMVATKWEWDRGMVFSPFGWKALIAVVTNAAILTLRRTKRSSRKRPKPIDRIRKRGHPTRAVSRRLASGRFLRCRITS
ncbi:MAG: putative Na+/H+ antiporter [Pseudomonadota bacterium]